eukprot:4971949-Pyramimonas_sp.AAC.1
MSMLTDLKEEAALYGLVVHLRKTKVLTNVTANVPTTVQVAGDPVQVVPKMQREVSGASCVHWRIP